MSRTGRRPGTPDTREAILAVARRRFATRGYEATSLRGIAADAKVDPALLIHYFGTKEGLFAAATGLPVRLSDLFAGLDGASPRESAEALVRGYLGSWTATRAATRSWPWSAPRSPTRRPRPCCGSS